MQTLVVVFKDGCAFRFARVVFGVCVGSVASEDFLPEGEAAGWAWGGGLLAFDWRKRMEVKSEELLDCGGELGWRLRICAAGLEVCGCLALLNCVECGRHCL